MAEEPVIPDNVRAIPADKDGNGFMVLSDVWAASVVGSDGECYIRKNNVISIALDEDE